MILYAATLLVTTEMPRVSSCLNTKAKASSFTDASHPPGEERIKRFLSPLNTIVPSTSPISTLDTSFQRMCQTPNDDLWVRPSPSMSKLPEPSTIYPPKSAASAQPAPSQLN